MPESATTTSGPSLEQILWRSMDRWQERPALLDAEEFAERIAHAFDGELPEEAFAERFFAGSERLHERPPGSLAEAVVRRAAQRLHVYEFDLNSLEYVIVEDKDKVVVVSEFGQFTLRKDDAVSRALEAAVTKPPERGSGDEPRGYFVRKSGEVVGIEVKKVARTLERLIVEQTSAPAVEAPARRLAPFNPVRRTMSEAREEQALRQEPRLSRPALPISQRPAARAQMPRTALFLLMPDGSLARAQIGAANRWEQMLGQHARSPAQRITIQTHNVVAVVSGAVQGSPGERTLARGEALAAVRAQEAPLRALGGDDLAAALMAGAREPAGGDRFWIQPEKTFRPGAPGVPRQTLVAQPLQLGQITGDPWADWALTAGEARLHKVLRPVADGEELPTPPALAGSARGIAAQSLPLAGAPVVAFRAQDGSILVNRAPGPVRLAELDRPDAPVSLPTSAEPAPRTGAVPFTALQTLRLALERTAAAGAYRLPVARFDSAPDAVEAGAALGLAPLDERRRSVRLAGPVGAAGRTARLLLSMPFPNRGELHVGDDLAAALHTWLAAPVLPAKLEAIDPSISGLPFLLHRALAQSGDWTPRHGAASPSAISEFAVRAPVAGTLEAPATIASRPPGPGEDEIVIPLPLWAQMGRGAIAETDRIMAAPHAPPGYAPPLGMYRLVVPGGGPLDLTEEAPAEIARVALSGPTGLKLGLRSPGTVSATTLGGSHFLGRVPLDDTGSADRGRSRIRIGAPIQGADLSALVSGARELRAGEPPPPPPSRPFTVARPRSAAVSFTPVAGVSAGSPARPGGEAIPPGGSSSSTAPAPSDPAALTTAAVRRAPPAFSAGSSGSGLPPGMWSGHRPTATADDQRWTYGWRHRDEPQTVSGVDLSGLSRPIYPQLPVALRFRYVGAPLWWSSGRRDASVDPGRGPSIASGTMRAAGLQAANSAASIWRSILVAGARHDDVSGGMDRGRDASADAMSSVARKFDALQAPLVAATSQPAGSAGAPAYIAISRSGAAGAISGTAAARARAQAVEMSIVAAIPAAPPPLESMSSMTREAEAPHARGRGHGHHAPQEDAKDAEDAVSHSKIEGSVDAIAQRIYHRIRRRIQSDRERFGG